MSIKWRSSFFLLLSFILCGVTLQAQSKNQSGYRVMKQYQLGGEGGWDYLTMDSKNRRLYVSHATHVLVVNADTGAIVGDIPDTPGVHGVAVVDDAGKGYVSNGRASTVTVFDLKTLKALKQIPVGKNPDTIIYDEASKRVFTMNGASQDVTAIDVKTDTVAGTLALGGRPEFAVTDEQGNVFVNLEDKSAIVEFNSRKLAVEANWPVAPAEEPSGLAFDRKHRRLFSVGSNKLMAVVNADTGKVLTTLPIGSGVDAAAFDPETGFIFSSNGEGTLTIMHEDSPDKYSVVETVTTQKGARTMALDPKTHQVYLVTAEFGPPPAPTPEHPRPRPSIVPGTFKLLVIGK
ncbi:MAG: YncE family protein [Acidobacteria bacterium]|nr:YncE family protein [Acidobacteriota bacterium]MBV9958008.1 YncE family protein [Acidobacteriota bacterium]